MHRILITNIIHSIYSINLIANMIIHYKVFLNLDNKTMITFDKFFNAFKKNWSIDDQIVFYGASKDFVQLIETLDIILKKKLN